MYFLASCVNFASNAQFRYLTVPFPCQIIDKSVKLRQTRRAIDSVAVPHNFAADPDPDVATHFEADPDFYQKRC